MSNLVELANELEDFPKEQLIQMSQDPNSTYPSYLVLSEIQRRTQMEKMYAAQQPKPETTVSDELVAEFAGSPSGLGAMAQSSDTPNAFQSGEMGNMAPPSPLMTAASGGLTGYQAGGGIGTGTDSLSATFTNPMQNQISNEELQRTKSILDSLPKNEDGSIDNSAIAKAIGSGLLTATAVGALLFPEPTTSALGAARLGTTTFGKNLLQLPGKIKSRIQSYMGKKALSKDPMKRFGPEDAKGLKPLQTTKQIGQQEIKDLKIPTRAAGLVGLSIAGNMINDGVEEEINPVTVQTQTEGSQEQVLKDVNTGDLNADEDKGLGQRFKDFVKSSRGADMLIGLGGAIGSARNLGELSSGISDAYFGIKSAEQAAELQGLQGKLIEAQISKYEADVANMPLDIAIKQYQSLNDLVDSGVLTAEEAKVREAALIKRIQQLQGITVAEKDKRDELLGLVQEVG